MAREKNEEGMPPPVKGAKKSDIETSRYDRLDQLAALGGDEEEMVDTEQQAAQLVLGAAHQLIQAAQLHPPIQDMIRRVLAVLKRGVDEIIGGSAPPVEGEMPVGRRRQRSPGPEEMMGGV